MKPSFLFAAHCELHVPAYERALLSVPALENHIQLQEKDLLTASDANTDGKYTLGQHLEHIKKRFPDIASDQPLLVLGLRNNLVNLRAPIIRGGHAFSVQAEKPQESRRPYYGIGTCDGKLSMGLALGGTGQSWSRCDFFCAGIPVLWEGLDNDALLDVMLTETADHSHIFDLPRGTHPLATNGSREAWDGLHRAFSANVHADRAMAAVAMRTAVNMIDPPLRRCDSYLHAVLGVSDQGTIVCIYAHGRLESLGQIARARGCRRAVCVENSGSVMPTYLPKGLAGERVPLLRAPNFRARGRAVLVLQLADATFDALPLLPGVSYRA